MAVEHVYRPVFQIHREKSFVSCNQCGRREECPRFDKDTYLHPHFNHFVAEGGYSSDYPGDLTQIEFHLCGVCLRALVAGFKIPVVEHWRMGREAVIVKHHETGEPLIVEDGWLRRPTQELPAKDAYTAIYEISENDETGTEKEVYTPRPGVWRHFKGNLYDVYDTVPEAETEILWVIYRALYGTSNLYAQPMDDFIADVSDRPERVQDQRFLPFEIEGVRMPSPSAFRPLNDDPSKH